MRLDVRSQLSGGVALALTGLRSERDGVDSDLVGLLARPRPNHARGRLEGFELDRGVVDVLDVAHYGIPIVNCSEATCSPPSARDQATDHGPFEDQPSTDSANS